MGDLEGGVVGKNSVCQNKGKAVKVLIIIHLILGIILLPGEHSQAQIVNPTANM